MRSGREEPTCSDRSRHSSSGVPQDAPGRGSRGRLSFQPRTLTSEDQDLDKWIEEHRYGRPNPRSIVTAREEIARHAFRILQGRWFLNRTADASYFERAGNSYLDRAEFDPWLPSLFSHEANLPSAPPQDKHQDCAVWFEESLPDLTDHILQEDMIIVHEKLRNGIDEWQVFSHDFQRREHKRCPKRTLQPFIHIFVCENADILLLQVVGV